MIGSSPYSNKGLFESSKYHTLLAINGDRHTVTRRQWFIGLKKYF